MRHRVAHRKLSRVTEHRLALLRNQAQALLRHELIHTTVAKAKELRPFVERLITVAKRGLANGSDTTHAVNARRMVRRDLSDREMVAKLFETIAPRFEGRPGGYTRLLRIGRRPGDDAEVARLNSLAVSMTHHLKCHPKMVTRLSRLMIVVLVVVFEKRLAEFGVTKKTVAAPGDQILALRRRNRSAHVRKSRLLFVFSGLLAALSFCFRNNFCVQM